MWAYENLGKEKLAFSPTPKAKLKVQTAIRG